MPHYRLILTRDVTESVVVEVEAANETAARSVVAVPEEGWAIDDGNSWDHPYVTNCEEI